MLKRLHSNILKIGFALSKWPHLHRAYFVSNSFSEILPSLKMIWKYSSNRCSSFHIFLTASLISPTCSKFKWISTLKKQYTKDQNLIELNWLGDSLFVFFYIKFQVKRYHCYHFKETFTEKVSIFLPAKEVRNTLG